MAKTDRLSILDGVISAFEKEHKVEISSDSISKIKRKQLMIPFLDWILGGGFPESRILEFYGPESGGKTTLALIIASIIQNVFGGHVTFVDAEQALDPSFYKKSLSLLTDKNHWLHFQPDYGEQGLDFVEKVHRSGATDLIIIDSVAALTAKAEMEGDMGQAFMGLQARMMGQGLRKINLNLKSHETSIIFINQIRMKIGAYGNPETTTGGEALKFYASGRYEVRKGEPIIGEDEDQIGLKIKVKSKKSKIAPPNRKIEMEFMFDSGINTDIQYIELAAQKGIIQKGGAGWFTLPNGDKAQGAKNVSKYFEDNPEEFEKIKTKVYDSMFFTAKEQESLLPEVDKESVEITDEIVDKPKRRGRKSKKEIEELEVIEQEVKESDESDFYEGEDETLTEEIIEAVENADEELNDEEEKEVSIIDEEDSVIDDLSDIE